MVERGSALTPRGSAVITRRLVVGLNGWLVGPLLCTSGDLRGVLEPYVGSMQFAHEYLLEAAERLSARGTKVFTLPEIIAEARALGAHQKDSTLRTMTSSHMCVSSPDHAGTTYSYFERVEHGRYRLVAR